MIKIRKTDDVHQIKLEEGTHLVGSSLQRSPYNQAGGSQTGNFFNDGSNKDRRLSIPESRYKSLPLYTFNNDRIRSNTDPSQLEGYGCARIKVEDNLDSEVSLGDAKVPFVTASNPEVQLEGDVEDVLEENSVS